MMMMMKMMMTKIMMMLYTAHVDDNLVVAIEASGEGRAAHEGEEGETAPGCYLDQNLDDHHRDDHQDDHQDIDDDSHGHDDGAF